MKTKSEIRLHENQEDKVQQTLLISQSIFILFLASWACYHVSSLAKSCKESNKIKKAEIICYLLFGWYSSEWRKSLCKVKWRSEYFETRKKKAHQRWFQGDIYGLSKSWKYNQEN